MTYKLDIFRELCDYIGFIIKTSQEQNAIKLRTYIKVLYSIKERSRIEY